MGIVGDSGDSGDSGDGGDGGDGVRKGNSLLHRKRKKKTAACKAQASIDVAFNPTGEQAEPGRRCGWTHNISTSS